MRTPSRHFVWLGAVVLAPSVVLAVLLLRLLEQDRELAVQRRVEAEQNRLAEAKRTLLGLLESGGRPIAFQGWVRQGRVVLDWQARLESGELERLRRAVGNGDRREFSRLAALPVTEADEHGVPLAVYAIPRLEGMARVQALRKLERSWKDAPHAVSATGLHLMEELGVQVGEMATHAEAAERFAEDAAVGARTAGEWMGWGAPLYVVGFAGGAGGELRFRAMAASSLPFPLLLSLERGSRLGEPFDGLRVEMPPLPVERRHEGLFVAMFCLSVGIALGGAVLLWRDFRREAELAATRTQFIASVSHELRTPLTAIRMFTESLKMNPELDETTRESYLDTMLVETERLSRLVQNVLEFSRMERGRKTYSLRAVDLGELVESVAASMRPLLEHAGFRLETEIDGEAGTVNADRDALQQALLNLVTNAVKYSGQSRVVRLQLRRMNGHAAISVADEGVGIEVREQKKIFESFYRVPSVENRSIQGAGLGLTLVRHVMEGHGGEVRVESEPGKGSVFTLWLPV